MGGGGGMISGQAPAVNINLDGVRSEIASIKKETDEIKGALREQGEQLQDIKVRVLESTDVTSAIITSRVSWRMAWRTSPKR